MGLILLNGILKGTFGSPIAQSTILGWILFGPIVKGSNKSGTVQAFSCILNETLNKFWTIESIPTNCMMTADERACEAIFSNTYRRLADGRFIVTLPFKGEPRLGPSRDAAIRMLLQLEKRFVRNSELRKQYNEFMLDYQQQGHMQVSKTLADPQRSYFLPHHAVIKADSSTTKLRVVFNGSYKTSTGQSLNDNLMTGPKLQPDLQTILLRFRTFKPALNADIKQMYRQIRVTDQDANFQRIVWRYSDQDRIQDYNLVTVTYGTTSAPYLAIKSLQQLAKNESDKFPIASKIVLDNFYVDDLLTGSDTEQHLFDIYHELNELLSAGRFLLRKWASNNSAILQAIPTSAREVQDTLQLDLDKSVKTLGLQWNPASDTFTFSVDLEQPTLPVTKRALLSDAAKLFDPLGLLSPTTIVAKMLFQKLWQPKVNWDEVVPTEIQDEWLHYRSQLRHLSNVSINRWLGLKPGNEHTSQLHGLSDASQSAYAAAVYLRTVDELGNITVHLITAKTKVAPLQTISLPRLELCAALLLARLIKHIRSSLAHIHEIYGWSDSTIVLAWLSQCPSKWATFVGNRVAEIQDLIPSCNWHHVRSEDNAADCASRGVQPLELLAHPLWWTGPPWLKQAETLWPVQDLNSKYHTELEQKRSPVLVKVGVLQSEEWNLLTQYSSLSKLQRVTAYILRFIGNIRSKTRMTSRPASGWITANELKDAMNVLIRITQSHYYSDEIQYCHHNMPTPARSSLFKLRPFLDENSILRVGGRLHHSQLAADKKYPIVLPEKCRLSHLIVCQVHILNLHTGPQMMLAVLHTRFWITGARKLVRKTVFECLTCFKRKPKQLNQHMGDLPRVRVEPMRPFLRSGVDVAGPFQIKFSKGRGAKSTKGYIAVFICMVTGAMHLELAGDMATQSFIGSYNRFISRRGRCQDLYSDNGSNFVGASRELRRLYDEIIKNEDLHKMLAKDATNWHFIPPSAPHMGGYWEAGVKRVKHHLKRILTDVLLTYEEFSTVLAQVEACVNSRPLCSESCDPSDLSVLTPGHYLIGEPMNAIPEPDLTKFNCNLVTRWQLLQQLKQHFWRRWSQEYIVQLQQRHKWQQPQKNIETGILVIVKDDRYPPTKWKLGRIIDVHPGDDQLIRVVTLRTENGIITRPVTKLCPLPGQV